jgi:O-antigen/teichoic acid export membrane protein
MIKKTVVQQIFHFSFSSYSIGLIGGIPLMFLPIMVLQILSPEDNAFFVLAFGIADIVMFIPSAFSTSLFAEGSFDQSKFISDIKTAFKHIYLLLIPAVIFFILFGDKMLLIFGKSYSVNGYVLLSILTIASLFFVPICIYSTYLRVKIMMRELQVIYAIIAGSILGISYLLLPITGIVGVGFAFLLTYAVIGAYSTIRLRKFCRVEFN